jgi:hypothetical protein
VTDTVTAATLAKFFGVTLRAIGKLVEREAYDVLNEISYNGANGIGETANGRRRSCWRLVER